MRKLIGFILVLIGVFSLLAGLNPLLWLGAFFVSTLFLWEFWVGYFIGVLFFK